MTTTSNANGDNLLFNIKADRDKEEADKRANEAIQELLSLIDKDRNVGDLISMDYDTAEVLIHDRLRQDVGGVPHGCLLIATRIRLDADPPDLNDTQTSLILLRALKASPLPNDIEMKHARLEAGQRAAHTSDNWDEGGKTDQFTLDQMRYAGAHCRILGTFRMNLDEETKKWKLEYGGDIDNFYAGQGMKVYKLTGAALERIANYTLWKGASSEPVEIGQIRYAASIRNSETVPVRMVAEDILAQRTALFGMTRTGKSNTTKTIASAVFRLRTMRDSQRVGQLIFDPNGEYANENPQDQGCLKNIGNIALGLTEDVITYGLNPHPNDEDRKITKFNFFGNLIPNDANKAELDEQLQSLYQGKEIINEVLREEGAGYIQAFIQADVAAPENIDERGQSVRYRRSLFVYRAILAKAGFSSAWQGVPTKGLFSKDIRDKMRKDPTLAPYVDVETSDSGKPDSDKPKPNTLDSDKPMTWDRAGQFCESFAKWVNTDPFKEFDRDYARRKNGRRWSDDRLLGLLSIFENTRGLRLIQKAQQWHDVDYSTDYANDIVKYVREGKLVIVDQALGSPQLNEQASKRIMRQIFGAQQEAFVNPELDESTGEYKKPAPVIIYVEEAHTLLPKGNETDTTNIWARIAKEGAKFNIGLVYSTQEPSTIQTNILKNTENWFIAHLNNTDETQQLSKYNDFADFIHSIIKVNETGFLRVRTLSSPYTLPVQINKFTAPTETSDAIPE